jgi:HlyD family secretion protein
MNFRSNSTIVAFTLAGALLAMALGLTGCKKKAGDAGESAVAVQAEHPTVGPISEEIAADAVIAPLAQAAIVPRISAPIEVELVQRGARVHKGQLLIKLEGRDLQGTAQDLRGGFTSAQAAYTAATLATIPEDVQKAELDLAQAKANLEVANRTAHERERLLKEGAIAGRDTDTAIAAAVQAQAAYDAAAKHLANVQATTQKTSNDAAKGQLTSAQGKLENAEAQAGFASLHSPIDGVVVDRPFFPGETPPAGTAVVTVMDTSSLLAKVHIAQAAALKLKVGGSAEINIPGKEDAQSATISLISPALDLGSTTVEVWLKLPNPGGRYKVGTPVHVILHGATIQNAVQVPVAAILPSDDGSTNVLVVGTDGAAHKRSVKIGLRTAEKVQILNGVSPGDMVVTEGGYGLDDGTKVKFGSKEDAAGGSKE